MQDIVLPEEKAVALQNLLSKLFSLESEEELYSYFQYGLEQLLPNCGIELVFPDAGAISIENQAESLSIPLLHLGEVFAALTVRIAQDSVGGHKEHIFNLAGFIAPFFVDALRKVYAPRRPESDEALLDYAGRVLESGEGLKETFIRFLGEESWRDVYSTAGMNGRCFREAFCRISNEDSVSFTWCREGDEWSFGLESLPGERRYLFPELPSVLCRCTRKPSWDNEPIRSFADQHALSFQERRILGKIYRGSANVEIGAELGIRLPTVKHHIYNIFNKVGVDSRAQLVCSLRSR